MKKFVLIIISVIMLFSACVNQTENITDTTTESYIETSAPKTQIDPAEEFGGITFGMTQDEVLSIVGKKPDYTLETYFGYWNEEHFNVSNAIVWYSFKKDNDKLCFIGYDYSYDESEQEQLMNDYAIIKDEILRRYPEEIWIDNYTDENDLYSITYIYTENRCISLGLFPKLLNIDVSIEEYNSDTDISIEEE